MTATIKQLIEKLQAEQPATRQHAVQRLGALRSVKAVDPLIATA